MPIGGEVEYDERIAECQDLPSLVLKNLRKFGNRTFVVDGLLNKAVTFQDVHDEAIQIALYLKRAGVGDGCYVAFITESTIEAHVFAIGVWLSGGCISPINATLTAGEIARLIDLTSSNIVFCGQSQIHKFEQAKNQTSRKTFNVFTDVDHQEYTSIAQLKAELSCQAEDISGFQTESRDPDDHIVYLLFTSGTTGVPKGVMLSSYAMLVSGCRFAYGNQPTLVTSPMYWISHSAAFTNALISGCKLIFPRVKYLPGSNQEDQHHLLSCIQKYKPQKWMTGTATPIELCFVEGVDKYDLSSLQSLSVGGSSILASQKKMITETLFKRNIIQERYGSTEAGFMTRQWTSPPPDLDDPKSSSFGPPSPGVEFKVVDMETGKELGPNQIGEFFCRSNSIMKGYINKELPQRYTKEDWYDLGDSGFYDEDGWIFFKSRTKEIIKYRGYQMAPADLEKVIVEHPDVKEACVVGAPHLVDGERPVAFVVKKVTSPLTKSALEAFINERVDDAKKPRGGIFFRSALPKSATGKILSRVLKDEVQNLCLEAE